MKIFSFETLSDKVELALACFFVILTAIAIIAACGDSGGDGEYAGLAGTEFNTSIEEDAVIPITIEFDGFDNCCTEEELLTKDILGTLLVELWNDFFVLNEGALTQAELDAIDAFAEAGITIVIHDHFGIPCHHNSTFLCGDFTEFNPDGSITIHTSVWRDRWTMGAPPSVRVKMSYARGTRASFWAS